MVEQRARACYDAAVDSLCHRCRLLLRGDLRVEGDEHHDCLPLLCQPHVIVISALMSLHEDTRVNAGSTATGTACIHKRLGIVHVSVDGQSHIARHETAPSVQCVKLCIHTLSGIAPNKTQSLTIPFACVSERRDRLDPLPHPRPTDWLSCQCRRPSVCWWARVCTCVCSQNILVLRVLML